MIYLLHFERPVSGHARHYMGSVTGGSDTVAGLRARLAEHRGGTDHAAALTRAAAMQGIGFWLVRVWRGGRAEERRMKQRPRGSNGHRFRCPLCGLSPAFAQSLPAVRL